jgi:1,2-diacylglycerol 3-alpha-glucosyltransferase
MSCERSGVRVANFTDTYLPRRDGVITSIRTLVAALEEAGHATLTVVPRHPGQPADTQLLRLRAVPCGVADLRVAPWLVRAAFAQSTLAAVAEYAPDVIHVHTPGPVGLLGVLAARQLDRPLVQTYHTDLHAYVEAYRLPARALRASVRLYARRLGVPRPCMRPGPAEARPGPGPASGSVRPPSGPGQAWPMDVRPDLWSPEGLRPDAGSAGVRPDGRPEGVRPDAASAHVRPDGRLEGVRPDAGSAGVRTDARPEGVRPDDAGSAGVPRDPGSAGVRTDGRPDVVGPRFAAMDGMNTLLLGGADAVVVPTRSVLERVRLPVPDERVFLVPTGVSARPAAAGAVEQFRRQHGIPADDQVVLFVGRVNREKGIELLVESFARTSRQCPRAWLVLVGAMYEPKWFANLCRRSGNNRRIVLAGQQPPDVVAAAYAAADVFAFASRTDTQALVLQEAALAGLPVVLVDPVLHRCGPLGGAGVLTDANPEAFSAALVRLLGDPALRQRIGADAAGQASRHTPARYAAAMLDVYAYAAHRRAARPTADAVDAGLPVG